MPEVVTWRKILVHEIFGVTELLVCQICRACVPPSEEDMAAHRAWHGPDTRAGLGPDPWAKEQPVDREYAPVDPEHTDGTPDA